MSLVEIEHLSVSFIRYTGIFRRQTVRIIDGLDLKVNSGEIVAVVGSSGSGKSLLAHAILGILPTNARVSGTIRFKGEPLTADRQAAIRGKEIALVPQSVNYLDPLMRVGEQVRHSVQAIGKDPVVEQRSAFKRYGLANRVERQYPYELSGGMARRVLVSTAAVSGARFIVADEPTPGLQQSDVNEALTGFRELADEGNAVLLITHDIESVLPVADKVAVFYAGTIVEIAPAVDFSGDGDNLRHPYTQALWRALPRRGFIPAQGSQPRPDAMQTGCVFAPRCGKATADCTSTSPVMQELRGGTVRCVHAS